MWSVGCILGTNSSPTTPLPQPFSHLLGELINGKAIFQGKSTLNQIERVLILLGQPSNKEIKSMESRFTRDLLNSVSFPRKKSFRSFFPKAGDVAIDFLKKLLSFDPN